MTNIKLSKRLSRINDLVADGYTHIWDCCCDHGLLGAALIERKASPNIHLVDIVPDLVAQVDEKLCAAYPAHSNWQTHCLDASELPISEHEGKHLVIIAGVGGDLTQEIVRNLYNANPDADIDFLLCPIRQHFSLRTALRSLDFHLKKECLVEENRLIYELILVASPKNCMDMESEKISEFGEQIWQPDTKIEAEIAQRYLQQKIAHYSKMKAGKGTRTKSILETLERKKSLLQSDKWNALIHI